MKQAVVIGAGLVGLSAAYRLQRDGWRVVAADPRGPAGGASAGNPGGISVSSVLPAAAPGVARNVPGWLLDRDGPLTIWPRRAPALAPWLIRFLMASRPAQFAQGIAGLAALTLRGPDAWERLLAEAGLSQMLRRDGHLIVYRSEAQFAAEAASWARRAALGMTIEEVEATALRAEAPALSPEYALARRVTDNGRLIDPRAVAQALAGRIVEGGGEIRNTAVTALSVGAEGAPALRFADGATATPDLVVIAAGAWSAPLARMVGVRVALEPERGYSVSWADAGVSIPVPVFSPSEKIMAAPVAGGLRLAGTAEFAGFDAKPDWRRADGLVRLGRRMFPALTTKAPERWAGLRPSTPDGLPVLGFPPSSRRVILAFGHGHLGVTSAAITAEIVLALAEGRPAPVDLAPYGVARFG